MYKIWDKKSDINGVSVSDIMSYRNDFKKAIENNIGVFLTVTNNRVDSFEFEDDVVRSYGLDESLSIEEVFSIYKKIKEEEKLNEEKEQITLEEQAHKISILETENADLLLDSAIKDIKIQTIEKDLADLTLEVVMGGM